MISRGLKIGIATSGAGMVIIMLVLIPKLGSRSPMQQSAVSPRHRPPTIVSTGQILGVKIGSTVEQAKLILDPLRRPGSTELREKEAGAREEEQRFYWRLAATEYDWILMAADEAGHIVRINANLRADKRKPFGEIGEVARASRTNEGAIIWDVNRDGDASYRVIAKGLGERASTIQILATDLNSDESR